MVAAILGDMLDFFDYFLIEQPGHAEADEEEAQSRDRAVDARRLHAALRLVQLEATQILCRRGVGRAANEGRKRPDVPNVVVARLLAEAAYAHVLDHAH